MKSIMFVCTGNICRSAMAHGYMQKKVYELNRQDEYLISSCGTNAINSQKSTLNAIDVMKKYNVDLTNHRATNIYNSNILQYDLIITMTVIQKENILKLYPKLIGKVFTLKEYTKTNDKYLDIDDPWGFDIQIYKNIATSIVDNVDKLLEIF
ncbi:MAG: low molecular weight protein arginine phosphatase [Clostridia bacterium]